MLPPSVSSWLAAVAVPLLALTVPPPVIVRVTFPLYPRFRSPDVVRAALKYNCVAVVNVIPENESVIVPPVQLAVVTYEWPASLVVPLVDPIHCARAAAGTASSTRAAGRTRASPARRGER